MDTKKTLVYMQIFLQSTLPLIGLTPNGALAQKELQNKTSSYWVENIVVPTTPDPIALPYSDTMGNLANSLSANGVDGLSNRAKSATIGY